MSDNTKPAPDGMREEFTTRTAVNALLAAREFIEANRLSASPEDWFPSLRKLRDILSAPAPSPDGAESARILRGWAKAYRDAPEHRFPSDPDAEFFPVDLEAAANLLSPSTGAAEPDAVRALDLLIKFAYAAWNAIDNSEQRDDCDQFMVIDKHFGQPTHDALDALDDLPDDQPGYVMGPIAKVQWALRSLRPVPAVGVTREALAAQIYLAVCPQTRNEGTVSVVPFEEAGGITREKCLGAAHIVQTMLSPVLDATVSEPVARALCCPSGCVFGDDCIAGTSPWHRKQINAILALTSPSEVSSILRQRAIDLRRNSSGADNVDPKANEMCAAILDDYARQFAAPQDVGRNALDPDTRNETRAAEDAALALRVRKVVVEECIQAIKARKVGWTLAPSGLAREDEADDIIEDLRALPANGGGRG